MKAEEFDQAFDRGEDVSSALDLAAAQRPGLEQRRVNVDFPVWMMNRSTVRRGARGLPASQSSRDGSPSASSAGIQPRRYAATRARIVVTGRDHVASSDRGRAARRGLSRKIGVEPVLQPEQHLGRLTPLPTSNGVAEVIEALDPRSTDDQRLRRRTAVRGERVRHTRRNDQQIAGPRGDDIILDQQVERAASSTCPMRSRRSASRRARSRAGTGG
jgi:hypothetical protein